MLIFVLAVLALIALWALSIYNQLVRLKTRIKASIQEIGNQLKRQADLIPNLIASVKGYLKHEKEVFKQLTEARKAVASAVKSGEAQRMIDSSQKMISALAPIRVVLESTPQLKGVEATTKLMDELRDTADKLMYSRRTLIDLTADYNIKLVTFPSSLVAKMFNFAPEPGLKTAETGEHLEVSSQETKTPKVEL